MGVDYASAADQRQGNRRDYFAVAIGRALPGGGIVLVDGYRAQLSQGEAEEQVKLLASQYPTTVMIGVEAIGKGEEFFNLLLRFSGLPLEPLHPGGRSKGERFEIGMAPLFRSKRVMVADVETAFLRSFREEWLRWPQGPHDDTLDAVAWMLHVGQGYLFLNAATEKKPNPLTKLGRR
jgi:phage terminase large subunit-like protein